MSLPTSKCAFVYVEQILNVHMHPNPKIQNTEKQRRREERLKLLKVGLPFPLLLPNTPLITTTTTSTPGSPVFPAGRVAECIPAGPWLEAPSVRMKTYKHLPPESRKVSGFSHSDAALSAHLVLQPNRLFGGISSYLKAFEQSIIP